ncbi:hypothetical protein, partial [Pseudomonas viridiflava]|uniref:hypothetical protein n=1 Tax=Pseudomonas viridiflava TaxID=33069 RepID=UPI001981567D
CADGQTSNRVLTSQAGLAGWLNSQFPLPTSARYVLIVAKRDGTLLTRTDQDRHGPDLSLKGMADHA